MNCTVKKIDRRKNYGIILDTETCNSMEDNLFYDIGWQVIDSKGNVYESRSFLCYEIFCGERSLMKSAYYAWKIPQYLADISTGKRSIATFYEIRKMMMDDIATYNCGFVVAHNSAFDRRALDRTQRWVTKSKYRYFLPYGLEWQDTMGMTKDVIYTMPTYRRFCEENGYTYGANNDRLRLTAEVLYQFITKDTSFKEEHKAIDDVDIERQIYAYCVRRHKKMDRRLYRSKK